jgi:arylsulfatase A-like enzyme
MILKKTDTIFRLLLIAIVSACAVSCADQTEQLPERPNLVFIFPDQMRAHMLGFLGKEPVLTPNLDEFANESLVFTDAISNSPVCSPYRAMLFSGKYPIANGVVTNTTSRAGEFGIQLKQYERCWSDVLKDNGYSLGYIGKWHLEYPFEPYIDTYNNKGNVKWNEWCPPERRHGFDFWYAYNTYDRHLKPAYWSTHAARDSFHYVDQWGPEHEADIAIEYINNENGRYRDQDKPFAMVVSMNPPHMPYADVPGKYVKMYDDKGELIDSLYRQPSVPDSTSRWGKYYRKHIKNQLAMVTGVDEQFGRIMDALEARGLEENTIVVFTSDHGDCLGKHDMISKSNPYEESLNIPLIIRWPEKIKAGFNDLLISVPDLYPTILALMGLEKKVPEDLEGTDFAELISHGKGNRPGSQFYFMMGGILSENPPNFNDFTIGERGVRTERYTLCINKYKDGSSKIWLWDRKQDPHQMKNIAEQNPELVKKLVDSELKYWLKRTNDPWQYE